jgi:hypothetical protein
MQVPLRRKPECLNVGITQRPGKRAHHVLDLDRRRKYAHINHICQRTIPAWRIA